VNGRVFARQRLLGPVLLVVVFSASCVDRQSGALSLSEIRQQIVGKWYVTNKSGRKYKISEFLPDSQVIDRLFAPDGTPGPPLRGRYFIPATDQIQFINGFLTVTWSLSLTRAGLLIRDEKYERVQP
jgi:hypothetical protein